MKNKRSSINLDVTNLNKLDGTNKNVEFPGASLELAVDESTLKPYQEQLKYYLDTEGDLNIVTITSNLGTMVGVYSSTKTLKGCAKKMLSDIFGIRNSSALRNMKDNGTVIKLPVLVGGRPAKLLGANYSFIKAHPELFPKVDLSWIDSVQSFTDKALASLKEGDAAIIIENYQYPDQSEVHTFDDCDDCYDAFTELCDHLENECKGFPGASVDYPNGQEIYDERLEEGHFDRGNIICTLVDGLRTARFTMVNCNYY